MMNYVDLLNNLKTFLSSVFFQNILNNNTGIVLFENRNLSLAPNTAYLIINEMLVEEIPSITYNLSLVIHFHDLKANYQKITEIVTKIIRKLLALGCRDINVNFEDEDEEKVNLKVIINFTFKTFIDNRELTDMEE